MGVVHYLNGKWVPTDKVTISAFDISVLRGYGIFDFLRTYDQKPFKLKEHIDRLFNSAKAIGIEIPHGKAEVTALVLEGLVKNKKNYKDFNIRIVVTGGIGADSMTPGKPNLIIMFVEAYEYPNEFYDKGIRVVTYEFERAFPEAKTINYLLAISAMRKAKIEGAYEVIYIGHDGQIFEGTTSNIFFVKGNSLITSKQDILKGITRMVIMDIAKKLKIPLEVRGVHKKELHTFDEAFVSASNKEVMPVIRVDRLSIGDGKVGPLTKQIMSEYRKLCRR